MQIDYITLILLICIYTVKPQAIATVIIVGHDPIHVGTGHTEVRTRL